MKTSLCVLVAFACLASFVVAHQHPVECYFNVAGMQSQEVGEPSSLDNPGEPEFFYNYDPFRQNHSIASWGGTTLAPETTCFDIWLDLPEENSESGNGAAVRHGEGWHRITFTGVWMFDHYAKQVWSQVRAEVEVLGDNDPSGTAWAQARITDDRASLHFEYIAEQAGEGEDGTIIPFTICTPLFPDQVGHGHNSWINLCGTTLSSTSDTWSGRARAYASSVADQDLIIVICNLQDVG